MTLKDIANAISEIDDTLYCKCSIKNQQIKLYSTKHPDEVKILLSPYYQKHIKENCFSEEDLDGVIEEVKTFLVYGT